MFVRTVFPEGPAYRQNWSDGLTSRPVGIPMLKWTEAHINTWSLEQIPEDCLFLFLWLLRNKFLNCEQDFLQKSVLLRFSAL